MSRPLAPALAIRRLSTEATLRRTGARFIAGVDEVGRGCWAGPVYPAAVVLPAACYRDRGLLAGVTDSKLLSPARRERLATDILRCAVGAAVAWVEAPTIDQLNILGATRLAMQAALACLAEGPLFGATPAVGTLRLAGGQVTPDYVLTDAVSLPGIGSQRAIVKGDRHCLAITASIVAKVTRDAEMCRRHALFPHLALSRNKGYGTPAHVRALHVAGLSPLHRRSFAPMKYFLGLRDHIAGALPAPVDGSR